MAQMLTERCRDRLLGVLSCYDRIVITGTLPGVCYAQGMMSFPYLRDIRFFDCARFAEPHARSHSCGAEAAATTAGLAIQHLSKAL